MNTVNYMNYFWHNNQYAPCSPSETTLYHYLLFEADRQQWVMPFKIPTQMLIAYTGISKQGVNDARESLQKRGLITYSKGEGKGRPALYSLVSYATNTAEVHKTQLPIVSQDTAQKVTQDNTPDGTQRETHNDTSEDSQEYPHEQTHEDTHNKTQENALIESQEEPQNGTLYETPAMTHEQVHEYSQEEPQEQAHGLPQHGIDGIPQKNTIDNNQILSQVLPISVLRDKILKDEPWQEKVMLELAKEGIELSTTDLTKLIEGFFSWQEQQPDNSERDEADCRRHIFNNIKCRLKKMQQSLQERPQSTGWN